MSKEFHSKYFDFVKTRIKRSGGKIILQNLCGHLSQLPFECRKAVGTSKYDLMQFLKKYPAVFEINDKGVVSLLGECQSFDSAVNTVEPKRRDSTGSCSSVQSEKRYSSLPHAIQDGEGVITRLFPKFGFMRIIKPIRREMVSVYFNAANFGLKESVLTEFDLHHSQSLGFNAIRSNSNCGAQYRATKVWVIEEKDTYRASSPNPRKNRNTGLYDPITLENDGIVQNIFSTHGFIEINGNPKNTVYFHLSNLCQYANLLDLTKVLHKGDKVLCSAIRSTKKDSKVRWEATKVWVKKKSKLPDNSDEEIFMSGSEDSSALVNKNPQKNIKSKAVNGIKISFDDDENKLVDQDGKISPSKTGVVIKFGSKFSELADADSSLFYLYESKVSDILWEFSDGDSVKFDAIRIKSAPGWKAVLVWVGKKPNIAVPNFPGEFGEFTDEETDTMMDSASYVSKESNKSIKSTRSISVKDSFHTREFVNSNKSAKYYKKDSKESHLPRGFISSSQKYLPGFTNSSRPSSRNTLPAFNESLRSKSNLDLNSANLSSKRNISAGSHSSQEFSRTPVSPASSGSRPRSRASSGSSQTSSISLKTPSELRSQKEPPKKIFDYGGFSNWGDSPFPDDDEIGDETAIKISDLELDAGTQPSTVVTNKERSFSDNIDKIEDKSSSKIDSMMALFNDPSSQNENAGDNAIVDYINAKTLKLRQEQEPTFSEEEILSAEEILSEEEGSEQPIVKPYIKTFESITGKIVKIYSRYAEISDKKLSKPVAFFWNDFYRNGVSVEEHFDDLREVIKMGDEICFDGFEILDDEKHCWQKVTLAWKGLKPNVKGKLSPQKFIEDHNLKVTIDPKSPKLKSKITNSKKDALSTNILTQLNTKSKFLTEKKGINDDADLNSAEFAASSLQATTYDKMEEVTQNRLMTQTEKWPHLQTISNFENLIGEVSEIFQRHGFEQSAGMGGACTEIVYFLHRVFAKQKTDELTAMKTSVTQATQTFVTGDVVSNQIYPC